MRALAIALLIVVTACALLVILLARVEPQPIMCMPNEEMREKVRAVMLQALEDGFHDHVQKTFTVWMASDVDQPRRASIGVRNGIRAYVAARAFVLKWSPPQCATTSP